MRIKLLLLVLLSLSITIRANEKKNNWQSEKLWEAINILTDRMCVYDIKHQTINDTLEYYQIYPDNKFAVYTFDNKEFLPVIIIFGDTTDEFSNKYKNSFNTKLYAIKVGINSLIPVDEIEQFGDSLTKIYPDVKFELLDAYETGSDLDGFEILYDYQETSRMLSLSCSDRVMHSSQNIEIHFKVEYIADTIILRPSIYKPEISLLAFGTAYGKIEFELPSDSIVLKIKDETFNLNIKKGEISISPEQVSDITIHSEQ